jgi:hypothetical protein
LNKSKLLSVPPEKSLCLLAKNVINMKIFIYLFIFLVISGAMTPAYADNAASAPPAIQKPGDEKLPGWLTFLFPTLARAEKDPSDTLEAPFADSARSVGPARPGLPENKIALNLPHRNVDQVADWVVMAVSESLTYAVADTEKTYNQNLRHFDDASRAQYIEFMGTSGILSVLHSKKYYLRSFAQEKPLLLNEGVVDGRYRWLFEVPLMISYMDRTAKGYKDAPLPLNQKATITVQVGRTNNEMPGKDLVIERWSGAAQKTAFTPDAVAPSANSAPPE